MAPTQSFGSRWPVLSTESVLSAKKGPGQRKAKGLQSCPQPGWALECDCQRRPPALVSPSCDSSNKNVSDDSRIKARCWQCHPGFCSYLGAAKVQIYSSWVAGVAGVFMECPQGPLAESLLFREESAGCPVPLAVQNLLPKASEQWPFLRQLAKAGGGWPLPGHLGLLFPRYAWLLRSSLARPGLRLPIKGMGLDMGPAAWVCHRLPPPACQQWQRPAPASPRYSVARAPLWLTISGPLLSGLWSLILWHLAQPAPLSPVFSFSSQKW